MRVCNEQGDEIMHSIRLKKYSTELISGSASIQERCCCVRHMFSRATTMSILNANHLELFEATDKMHFYDLLLGTARALAGQQLDIAFAFFHLMTLFSTFVQLNCLNVMKAESSN